MANLLRWVDLPAAMADWSLSSLLLKLIEKGSHIARHASAITSNLAEVAVTGPKVRTKLAAIRQLRAPQPLAWLEFRPKPNESGTRSLHEALTKGADRTR